MLLGTWLTEKLFGAVRAAVALPGWLRGGSPRELTQLGVRSVVTQTCSTLHPATPLPAPSSPMNLDTVLMVFPVVTSVWILFGVLVVLSLPGPARTPCRSPELRCLLGTGFMLWLAWMATGGLFGQPVLDWCSW